MKMYCKHCGKQIADDSSFCQYCGGKVMDESLSQESNTDLPTNSENNLIENTPKVAIVTKVTNPIQVEVSLKGKNNSSAIANEIVGNLKMVGIAAIIVFIYLICFISIHTKDIKHYDYETHTSFYGESCYDPSYLTGNWKFHWEEHYYETLYFKLYDKIPLAELESLTPEEYL